VAANDQRANRLEHRRERARSRHEHRPRRRRRFPDLRDGVRVAGDVGSSGEQWQPFSVGGSVNPLLPPNVGANPGVSTAHEDPALLTRFYAFAKANPLHTFTITSGDRTQQPASSQFPIAPEGTSFHERFAYGKGLDEAIDVYADGSPIGSTSLDNYLYAFGLQTPVVRDPVHVTMQGWNG
jgi:hypothetical protein